MVRIAIMAASLHVRDAIILLPYWVGMFIRQISGESRHGAYISVMFQQKAQGAQGEVQPYTVRNTMMMIAAKPTMSVGAKTVPSMSALVTAAEMGSMVAIMLARMPPRSLMPCI